MANGRGQHVNSVPPWLPALIRLEDFSGDWKRYVNEVFSVFHADFIKSQPVMQGKRVMIRRDPMFDGKEAGFWHCISEGREEEERTPDLRRCERIGWIRAIIEHSDGQEVRVWRKRKKGEKRLYLWFSESYLVILGVRNRYFQLVTAFLTDAEHTRRKLRAECNEATKSWHRPA
jgi:hypothetical protein